MLLRILELCLTIVVLVLTTKEIVLPLILNKPLFPMVRKTMQATVQPAQPVQPKKERR